MPLRMASRTVNLLVLTLEFELADFVIEKWDAPTREADVTFIAGVFLKLHPVGCGVTKLATRIGVILPLRPRWVTSIAWLLLMTTTQSKARHAMIELGFCPALGAMTLTTGRILKCVAMGAI